MRLRDFFPGERLSQIHAFDLERYKRHRVGQSAPVSANRELAVLKSLFYRCQAWKRYEGENPVRGVKFLPESPGRLRYLELDEEARLLAACAEPLRTLVLLAIYSGVRLASEGLTLLWSSIDLGRRMLTVEARFAKSKKARTVPLHPLLYAALVVLKTRATGEAVFTYADGRPIRSCRRAFDAVCARAGLKDVTPHVLRHTLASRLVMAGVRSSAGGRPWRWCSGTATSARGTRPPRSPGWPARIPNGIHNTPAPWWR
jgi:integrase